MGTKIKLPDNYQIFTLDGNIKGTITYPVVVEFNCDEADLVEHLLAKGLNDLIPLLNNKTGAFNPVTGEKIAVAEEVEEIVLSDEEKAKAIIEGKSIPVLTDFAVNKLKLDLTALGKSPKKGALVAFVLENAATETILTAEEPSQE